MTINFNYAKNKLVLVYGLGILFFHLSGISSIYAADTADSTTLFLRVLATEKAYLEEAVPLLDKYFRTGQSAAGIKLANKILARAKARDYRRVLLPVYNRLGTIYTNMGGKEHLALEALEKAMQLAQKDNDIFMVGVINNNLGNVYRNLSLFPKAMECYIKSLEISEKLADSEGKAYAFKNIGITYELQGWYDKALDYHQKALTTRLNLGDTSQILSSLLNIGVVFNKLQLNDSASYYLFKAVAINKQKNSELADELLYELAALSLSQGDTAGAITNLKNALPKSIAAGKARVSSVIIFQLANLSIEEKRWQEAAMWIDSLNSLADKHTITKAKINYFDANFRLQTELGNELEALKSYQKMAIMRDSLNQLSNAEDILQQHTILELLEKENQLNLEKTRQAFERNQLLFMLFSLLALLILLSVLFYLKYKANQALKAKQLEITKKNLEVADKNKLLEIEVGQRTKELVEYSQQLERFDLMTDHNFRGPVARILGLSNLINISTNNEEKLTYAEKIIETTHELDVVTSNLARILEVNKGGSQAYCQVDLEVVLFKTRKLLDEMIRNAQAEITWDFSQIGQVFSIPSYLESIFYNLVSNSLKYKQPGKPLKLNIAATQSHESISLRFADNGIGINLDKFGHDIFKLAKRFHRQSQGKGMGLFMVKSQVDVLGGKIQIDSLPNVGTTFIISLPLQKKGPGKQHLPA